MFKVHRSWYLILILIHEMLPEKKNGDAGGGRNNGKKLFWRDQRTKAWRWILIARISITHCLGSEHKRNCEKMRFSEANITYFFWRTITTVTETVHNICAVILSSIKWRDYNNMLFMVLPNGKSHDSWFFFYIISFLRAGIIVLTVQ